MESAKEYVGCIKTYAPNGISIKDATLYTTFSPCLLCAKMIINGGIREVVYNEKYTIDGTASRILAEAGVILRPVKQPDQSAE